MTKPYFPSMFFSEDLGMCPGLHQSEVRTEVLVVAPSAQDQTYLYSSKAVMVWNHSTVEPGALSLDW